MATQSSTLDSQNIYSANSSTLFSLVNIGTEVGKITGVQNVQQDILLNGLYKRDIKGGIVTLEADNFTLTVNPSIPKDAVILIEVTGNYATFNTPGENDQVDMNGLVTLLDMQLNAIAGITPLADPIVHRYDFQATGVDLQGGARASLPVMWFNAFTVGDPANPRQLKLTLAANTDAVKGAAFQTLNIKLRRMA